MTKNAANLASAIPASDLSTRVDVSQLMSRSAPSLRGFLRHAISSIAQAGDDEETLWQIADRAEQMEMAGRLIAGMVNRELSTRVDTRRLSEELRRRGKTRSAFYDSINVLLAFEALPNGAAVESLAAIGYSKVRAVLSWEPEERIAFASGEPIRGLTLDDAVDLPTREFEKLTRKTEPDLARLESENQRLRSKLELSAQAARDVARLQQAEPVPAFARELREEAMFLSQDILSGLEMLEDTAERCLFGTIDHPERFRWLPASARTLHHALATAAARTLALMKRARPLFEGEDDPAIAIDSQLEPSELKRFELYRDALLPRLAAQKKARDDERANSTTGKRGAPRGPRAKK